MDNESKGPDPYEAVIADLTAQRERIDQAIGLLQNLRALGAALPQGSFGMAAGVKPADPGGKGPLGPGAFLGMSIVDAAKKLLAHERRQMSNPEIATALQQGGLVMNSAEPANTIGSVLTRRFQQVGDVVKVGRGVWGLKEWYPNRTFRALPPKGEDAPAMIGKPAGGQEDLGLNHPAVVANAEKFAEDDDEEIAPF